jgi:hypothetical protein
LISISNGGRREDGKKLGSVDSETIFDIQGLGKLKETFDLIDKSVDGIRLKSNNAYKYNSSNNDSSIDKQNCVGINDNGGIGNTSNILEMATVRLFCELSFFALLLIEHCSFVRFFCLHYRCLLKRRITKLVYRF